MDKELLRSIGLTDSEIKVYMALLELGSSSKGPVVDQSGVASSKIYELLEKLQHKGLVSSVVRSGVKYFEAASPTRLLDYMQEKERSLKEKKLELESLIPELELKRSMAGIGSETQVFKGMKGAATSFDDILRTLKKGDEYYVFGISQFSPHFERFVVNFHKKRAKAGIKCKVIVNQLAKDIGEKLEPIKLTRVKYIQKELFTPFVFIIYADKVLISIGLDEVFIQVKSEKLASGLKRYADYMWGQDITVSRGFDGMKHALQSFLDSLEKGETWDVLGATFGKDTKKFANLFMDIHQQRLDRGVKGRMLFEQSATPVLLEDTEYERYQKTVLNKNNIVRYLPYKTASPVAIFPSNEKTLLVIQEKDPTVITIDNKDVSQAFKNHFEQMWNQDVKVSRGIEGVQAVWNQMLIELESGEEYYVLGASWRGQKKEVYDYFVDFHRRRQNKKVKAKFLFVSGTEQMIEKNKDSYYPYAEVKFLPEGVYEGMQINLYKDKVLMFVWKEKEPIVFTIEDKKVYATFKTYFDTLWDQETKVLKGVDAVQQIFEEMLEAGHCDFIGARGYFVDRRPKYVDDWEKRAQKKGFTMRNLVDPETKGHRITKFSFTETKYTLKKEFSTLSAFWIFGEKVVISNWMGDEEPIVLVINNKNLYHMYKQQFETLWDQG